MEKQWCAFFVHGHERGHRVYFESRDLGLVKQFFLIGLLVIAASQIRTVSAYAEPSLENQDRNISSMSSPSGTPQLEPQFLSLPAFDFEKIDPAKKTSPSPESGVKVGDALRLKITGLHLPGINNPSAQLKLDVPSGVNLQNEGWDIDPIQNGVDPKNDHAGELAANEFGVLAIPLKPGSLTLPSLALRDTNGKAVARTNPFSVSVQSAIKEGDPQPAQPAELEPPVGLRFPFWIIALIAAGGLILFAGLIYLGYQGWRKRKPRVRLDPVVQLAEDEVALKNLAELIRLELIKKGQFKSHYFRISEILKAYVGARFRFDALESTTGEMLKVLESKKSVGDSTLDAIEVLFNKLDLVKFTDHVPGTQESDALLGEAKEFIVSTRRPATLLPAQPSNVVPALHSTPKPGEKKRAF